MAEAEDLDSEEGGEAKPRPAPEDTYARVSNTPRREDGAEESSSVTRSLLPDKHQDTQTATAAADRGSSVPQGPKWAVGEQGDSAGSVRSLSSSGSSRHECPICSEQFDTHGDHRITFLNCDHALCHTCTSGIMRRAKDPGRLRCPFCRQTTPFPQWEIRRLQEESYSGEARPALVAGPGPGPGPGPEAPVRTPERRQEAQTQTDIRGGCVYPPCLVRGLRLMRLHSLCLSVTVLLLLFLICWAAFCIFVPLIILSKLLANG